MMIFKKVSMTGDDQSKHGEEESKKTMGYSHQSEDDSGEKKKKVKWFQLILGLIGMTVGTLGFAQSSSPMIALVVLLLVVIFFVVYIVIKTNR